MSRIVVQWHLDSYSAGVLKKNHRYRKTIDSGPILNRTCSGTTSIEWWIQKVILGTTVRCFTVVVVLIHLHKTVDLTCTMLWKFGAMAQICYNTLSSVKLLTPRCLHDISKTLYLRAFSTWSWVHFCTSFFNLAFSRASWRLFAFHFLEPRI